MNQRSLDHAVTLSDTVKSIDSVLTILKRMSELDEFANDIAWSHAIAGLTDQLRRALEIKEVQTAFINLANSESNNLSYLLDKLDMLERNNDA